MHTCWLAGISQVVKLGMYTTGIGDYLCNKAGHKVMKTLLFTETPGYVHKCVWTKYFIVSVVGQ